MCFRRPRPLAWPPQAQRHSECCLWAAAVLSECMRDTTCLIVSRNSTRTECISFSMSLSSSVERPLPAPLTSGAGSFGRRGESVASVKGFENCSRGRKGLGGASSWQETLRECSKEGFKEPLLLLQSFEGALAVETVSFRVYSFEVGKFVFLKLKNLVILKC